MARDMMKKRVLKLQFNAPLVLIFAIVSLVALIANQMTAGAANPRFFSTYGFEPGNFWWYIRLVGHVLGHRNWSHYISNMMLILVVGPTLEEKYGSWPLFWCILFTAVVSGLIHCFWEPTTALLGASGIVFMMIMLSSLAGMRDGAIPITLILVAIIYLGGELVAAFTGDDSVSRLTHIIGGLCGTFLGFFLARRR